MQTDKNLYVLIAFYRDYGFKLLALGEDKGLLEEQGYALDVVNYHNETSVPWRVIAYADLDYVDGSLKELFNV